MLQPACRSCRIVRWYHRKAENTGADAQQPCASARPNPSLATSIFTPPTPKIPEEISQRAAAPRVAANVLGERDPLPRPRTPWQHASAAATQQSTGAPGAGSITVTGRLLTLDDVLVAR